jgi:hypothetical protein
MTPWHRAINETRDDEIAYRVIETNVEPSHNKQIETMDSNSTESRTFPRALLSTKESGIERRLI